MPSFDTSRRVRHSAAQMFDLVADIESYPAFLPLCLGTRVLRRTAAAGGDGVELIVAEMRIGYKAIRETFTSRVTLDRSRLLIDVEYVDGPFRRMHNRWSFADEDAANGAACSRVDFFIDYEFRNRALALLMGVMFDKAFRRFAQAFEERADQVYGPRGALSPAQRGDAASGHPDSGNLSSSLPGKDV
jgi:coenzyme Q-binding protein COQ10